MSSWPGAGFCPAWIHEGRADEYIAFRRFLGFGQNCVNSAGVIAEEAAKILRALGGRISYKGSTIGHLKCMVRAGEHHVQMSAANFPDISVKADPGWYEREYDSVELIINIIVFGYGKAQLETFLNDSMEGSIFRKGGRKSCGWAFR